MAFGLHADLDGAMTDAVICATAEFGLITGPPGGATLSVFGYTADTRRCPTTLRFREARRALEPFQVLAT